MHVAVETVPCSLGARFDDLNDLRTRTRLAYATGEVLGVPKHPHLPSSGPYLSRNAPWGPPWLGLAVFRKKSLHENFMTSKIEHIGSVLGTWPVFAPGWE